ncbi:hypothetical protein BDV93DRAFT_561832 [Ceratobasidium sp. AG-I]|nr:hypothetical protein BDV93DRAFT_561832 [Ceratobasidium sp. AG-I]
MTAHTDQTNPSTQQINTKQPATAASLSPSPSNPAADFPGQSLGLLHDSRLGPQTSESKDVAILRRLKIAILEGQHPYFKANVDLSNLQDLVLASSASHITNGAAPITQLTELSSQMILGGVRTSNFSRDDASPALSATMRSRTPVATNSSSQDGKPARDTLIGRPPISSMLMSSLDEHSRDTEMKASELIETNQARITFEDSGADIKLGSSPAGFNVDDKNVRPTPGYTLGRYTLHSPGPPESARGRSHKRNISDTSTVLEANNNSPDPITIKRESPPYQLYGSQEMTIDPSPSSISSFASAATTSTSLTSENEVDGADALGNTGDGGPDLSGYNPKYGNKADFLRHQKVRVKMIESIEEKNRRLGHRPEESVPHKSPVRPTELPTRRGSGLSASPVREREHASRTNTMPPPPRASLHTRGVSPSNLRRAPSLDNVKERLPPPLPFQQSPRRSQATAFSRPISPVPTKYVPPRQSREYSPPRDVRPQYLPYDEPRATRPRPVVSSPPRGSPPRESSAPRTSDRQPLDSYSSSFPRTESRSFDYRPPPPASVFSDRPRDNGSFDLDRDDTWASSARGLPRAPPPPPPSRDSPSRHELNHERTSFGSSSLPANPSAGYRPQPLPDPPTRYAPYDSSARRPDASWTTPREWDSASRPPDAKPKLQDRFTMEPTWPRDEIDARPRDDYGTRTPRDDFASRGRADDYPSTRFRREASPYNDGLRSGFSRPSEIEGMRPMKRSRPDDGYAPRGPGPERGRYDLDARPAAADYYGREPPRRPDDEYVPRTRPPYNGWAGGPP